MHGLCSLQSIPGNRSTSCCGWSTGVGIEYLYCRVLLLYMLGAGKGTGGLQLIVSVENLLNLMSSILNECGSDSTSMLVKYFYYVRCRSNLFLIMLNKILYEINMIVLRYISPNFLLSFLLKIYLKIPSWGFREWFKEFN